MTTVVRMRFGLQHTLRCSPDGLRKCSTASSVPHHALQLGCAGADYKLLVSKLAELGRLPSIENDATGQVVEAALEAAKRVYPHVRMTALQEAPWLAIRDVEQAYLKLETEQVTGSFKARGAVSKVTSMQPDELSRGLVTSSTGNHGLGLAYACSVVPAAREQARLRVFVPSTSVVVKRAKLAAQGAQVVIAGDDCLESERRGFEAAANENCVWVSPYNDIQVVAGQATIGLELLAQLPPGDLDDVVVFCPVGGGGLSSGIAAVLKAANKNITFVGCQPENSQVMKLSVEAGHIVDAPSLDTLSDGTSGGIESGAMTLKFCHDCIDEWAVIEEPDMARSMLAVLEKQSKLIEGSAAVAVAAATQWAAAGKLQHKRAVVICCGGNVALSKLQHALDLASEGSKDLTGVST